MPGSLIFKQADSAAEFYQIHRLNYRTFTGEIKQHPADGSGILVDRFHDANKYFIALDDGRLLGMTAVNDQGPFSIERRLPEPAILQALGGPLLEVRLLALEPEARRGMILAGILWDVFRYATAHGYSHLIISGIVDRLSMYTKLGFRALGPAVRDGGESFVPMALALGREPAWLMNNPRLKQIRRQLDLVSVTPGPEQIP